MNRPSSTRASRRSFLRSAAGAVAAAALTRCDGGAKSNRPNLLIVMVDEHAASVAGCYGDSIAITPHLDQLAGEGVVFDNCYTNSPVCGPARESFLSGRWISQTSVWGNSCWLPSPDTPTFTAALAAAGYDVALSGKMHLDRTRRYGMREVWPSHANRFFKSGKGVRLGPEALLAPSTLWPKRAANFHAGEDSVVLRHDRTAVDAAADFLASRRSSDPPFCLIVGLIAPHFPLVVPERWLARFRGRVPPPHVPHGYVESLPLNYRLYRAALGPTDDDSAATTAGRECYWGLVGWMDEQLGRLLTACERSPGREQTAIVYTSDHGENKGDHGMWWKGAMFDSATRVPLIVRWPQRWQGGQRRAGATSLIDVAATLADLGGIESAAYPAQGDSLMPWLDDATHAWKDNAVSEYYGHYVASGFTMLREGDWKYVYHARRSPESEPERELYQLKSDPAELVNLAPRAESASTMQRLHQRLLALLGRDPEEIETQCRREIAIGYQRAADPQATGPDSSLDREEGLD